jgi:arabinose-5-phosphate isomerase
MNKDPVKIAKRTLKIESEAIKALIARVNDEFRTAVELILKCKGKVVITGIGKSGLIGQKIASTLTGTGTPSFFLHPAEGIHGDLGILSKNDIIIAISNSGETEEILKILPSIKRLGIKLIAMTGRLKSNLAKSADVVLNTSVKEEACPLNLAPTASTTATLALGDALAVALLELRGFKKEDFALIHPGGTLGKKLLLSVADLMHTGSEIPLVKVNTEMKDVLLEMTSKRFGITGVVNESGELIGVITDGDLRRALEKYPDIMKKTSSDIMTTNPKWIEKTALAAKALRIMEEYSITCLFVYENNRNNIPIGIIHLHDLLRAGVV